MATPFSPFVGRRLSRPIKRRQSDLPSDLIDWDAPEIPEVEKQKIIYEDYIRDLTDDHAIETILNEQIFKIAHDTVVDDYKSKVNQYEDELTTERSRVNLLLGQIKIFETTTKESDDRLDELEAEVGSLRDSMVKLEEERDNLVTERNKLQVEIEDLTFRNNETACELNHNIDLLRQRKGEFDELQRKFVAVKKQLNLYKRPKDTENQENEKDG